MLRPAVFVRAGRLRPSWGGTSAGAAAHGTRARHGPGRSSKPGGDRSEPSAHSTVSRETMLHRREFVFTSGLATLVSRAWGAKDAPTGAAKVVKLFRSPEGHPNALETAKEGFWIGEQTTDRAHLVDFQGKLIRSLGAESSNTSGLAYGGGYLWMAANG